MKVRNLGAPALRRPVGNRKQELAGWTPRSREVHGENA